ncbi:MAG: hypothetical protein P1V35_00620 [Planctomycetota bacterium]|nr:hypothetical protein [Planctomycetota bacterium]
MIERATLRWFSTMALRSPIAWVIAACAGAAWPVFTVLLSLGITTSTRPPAAALYEIGFVASLVGASLAVVTLTQGSWWLARTTPMRRFRAEFTGVATGSFALILLAWFLPGLLSLGEESLPVAHMLATATKASLHLAAISVCVLALPFNALVRAALIPLLAWFIPSLLAQGPSSLVGIGQCLQIAGDFQFPWTEESPAFGRLGSSLPILGLCLLRLAEATRRAFHPCATPS